MTSIFFPNVAGLDLSVRGPGMCVLSGDPHARIGAGLVSDSAMVSYGEDVRGPERLSTVSASVWSWLVSRGMGKAGDVYVIEGYAYGAHTAHHAGEIGGCMRRVIWETGGNIVVVPPSTLKKYVTGSGNADKNVVMKTVFKKWSFDRDDDNECDAFACALLGLVSISSAEIWTAAEREILTKKVERYAGKDQESWLGGDSTRKVAGRARKRVAKHADLGSPVLSENVQGPRRRRRHDPGRSGAPEDGVRPLE